MDPKSFSVPKAKIDLQELQAKQILKILKFNSSSESKDRDCEEDVDCVWKIIIYDKFCQEILSTLFKVGNLRSENVTLHLNLFSQKEKLQGVKTIYLVQPVPETIKMITEDITKDLYDNIYINFSNPIDGSLLESFASSVARTNSLYKIKQVFQHHINFVSLNTNFFTLNMENVYSELHCQKIEASAKSSHYDYIALSLFSLFRTMKTIPFVLVQSGQAITSEIYKRLEARFSDFTQSKEFEEEIRENHFLNATQPLLIVLERGKDFSSTLLHPWFYGALIHDLLEIKNNKVEMMMKNDKEKSIKMEYDLDNKTDKFWEERVNQPFPLILPDFDKELKEWEVEKGQMGHKKANSSDLSSSMSSAVDLIPAMADWKKRIDMHINIGTHLKNEIEERELDRFFEIGSSMIYNTPLPNQDKLQMIEILQNPKYHVDDKVRLLMLYYLHTDDINVAECKKLEGYLNISNQSVIDALNYVKKQKRITFQTENVKESEITLEPAKESKQSSMFNMGDTLFLNRFAEKLKTGAKGIWSGVQSIIPGQEKYFYSTRVVESLLEGKLNKHSENIHILDPLNKSSKETYKVTKNFSNIVVFVADGGNYNEYQDILTLAKKLNKTVIYGCSTVYNAKNFIAQLGKCQT